MSVAFSQNYMSRDAAQVLSAHVRSNDIFLLIQYLCDVRMNN